MIKNALVVLNYRDYETTAQFIKNVVTYKSIDKIVVVDNNSNDGSYEKFLLLKNEKVHVIKSEKNGGYSYGNNIGIKYAINEFNPTYIIISNPDVKFKENTIYNMMNIYNKYNDIGIVAPKMIDKNNIPSAWKLPKYYIDLLISISLISKIIGNPYKYKKEELKSDINYVETLSGSFFIIPSKTMREIDYMDEDVFLYCEEIILSYKLLSRGYKNILISNDEFIHEHSVSINKSIGSRVQQHRILFDSKLIYYKKYKKISRFKEILIKIVFKIGIFEKKCLFKLKSAINK